MTPHKPAFQRSESAFHQNLTKEDREELLKLQTLRELPKSRYATQSCITGIPSGRGRKVVYSHIEVYKMVENIATDLREAGVRPQTPCAFILENCIEAVVFFLALQWIGAIAVPVDPTMSSDEITAILEAVNTSIVVSAEVDEDDQQDDEHFQKVKKVCESKNYVQWFISRSTNAGVYLDRCGRRAGEGAAWSGGAGDFKYDPSETCFRLAYGEVGHCLVVEMSHRGAAEATRDYASTYGLTAEQSTILVAPFYSIHGLMCVLASMYSGGNIVIPTGSVSDPQTLLRHTRENKVDWFSADVDTVLDLYEKVNGDKSLGGGMKLSFIRSYGGNIDAQTIADVEPVLGAAVLEAYGTPETCDLVSANREFDKKAGTCGKAVGACEIAVFDNASSERLPAGTVGRIGTYGGHVSKRYINSDYANKTCYLDVSENGRNKTYFLTGDTGSLSEDGYLTVTSHGEPKKRAAALAAQEENEIKSQREVESARALAIEEETRKRLEEERRKGEEEKTKLEEEARRLEEQRLQEEEAAKLEETRQQEEAARKLEEEAWKLEEEHRKEGADENPFPSDSDDGQDSDDAKNRSGDEDNVPPDVVGVTAVRAILPHTNAVEEEETTRSAFDQDVVEKIMERLDQIESNQRRLEEEVEGRHRLEMARMRELIAHFQEVSEANAANAAPAPVVNMDAVHSAVSQAAASAERSSRDTAAAAQAAKDAAAAAAAAAAANQANATSVVEVQDPNAVQKTVLVSLEEVEQAVKLHPAVDSARAFGRPDPRFGVEVFCAINARKGARISEPWLKLHAQSLLPAAFVPKKFFYKDGLSDHEDRTALSADETLKRISEISGYSNTKIIKSPAWSPQQVAS